VLVKKKGRKEYRCDPHREKDVLEKREGGKKTPRKKDDRGRRRKGLMTGREREPRKRKRPATFSLVQRV